MSRAYIVTSLPTLPEDGTYRYQKMTPSEFLNFVRDGYVEVISSVNYTSIALSLTRMTGMSIEADFNGGDIRLVRGDCLLLVNAESQEDIEAGAMSYARLEYLGSE